MIEIMRKPIYEGQLPDLTTFTIAVVIALASLGLGAWVFTRKMDELAYHV